MAANGSVTPFPRFFAVLGYTFFTACVFLLLGELVSWGALAAYHAVLPPSSFLSKNDRAVFQHCFGNGTGECLQVPEDYGLEIMSSSPVYLNQDWAEDFWQQNRARSRYPKLYEPFVEWRSRAWSSQYLNVDQTPLGTVRRTSAPEHCPGPALRVWMLGGSAVFGEGSPDSQTIASDLVRRLSGALRRCVEVTNLGVEGYATNQEAILLARLLKSGPVPDVVIFYDGANDSQVGVWDPGDAAAHNSVTEMRQRLSGATAPRFLAHSNLLRGLRGLLRRLGRAEPQAGAEDWSEGAVGARVQRTLDNYEANLREARALSQAYGFRVYAFWQPTLAYGSKPAVPFEATLLKYRELAAIGSGKEAGEHFLRSLRTTAAEAERRASASKDFVFLGHIFDRIGDPVYIDIVHLGPQGDDLVAQSIAEHVAAQEDAKITTSKTRRKK